MDPFSTVTSAIQLVNTILEVSQRAQENRNSSILLGERCRTLMVPLQKLSSQHIPNNYANLLDKLVELLNEVNLFIKKFIKPTSGFADIAVWYEMLMKDHNSHLNSFCEFGNRINQSSSELDFGGLVNLNENVNQVESQNVKVREDLESLSTNLASFREELYASSSSTGVLTQCGDQLQKLQCDFLNFLDQWDNTAREISQLNTLVKDVLRHLKYQRPQQTEVIRNELVVIRAYIQDLTQSAQEGCSCPQQKQLIESLSDYLVDEMTRANESTREIFSKEFKKVQDVTKKFHEESNKKSDEILSSLQRLEFTEREKTIRETRLKPLSIYQNQISINQSEDGLLGRGAFGEVRRGRYGTRDVAIKIIQSGGRTLTENEKKTIENEVLLMSHCPFPSILQLYGYCQVDARTVYLVLELCPCGSLWSYLDNKAKHPSIPPNLSLAWISDIFSALKHLHDRGIIHRDVKAENVLLAEGFFCKLTDFGLSKQQMESSLGRQSTNAQGTLLFMAPEVRNDHKPTHRSDIYSVGVTAYQILNRSPPPRQRTRISVLNSFKSLPPVLKSLSDLLVNCLEEDPKRRVSSEDAFEMISGIQESDESLKDPRHGSSARILKENKKQFGFLTFLLSLGVFVFAVLYFRVWSLKVEQVLAGGRKDVETSAFTWLMNSAEQGNGEAQKSVGSCYDHGVEDPNPPTVHPTNVEDTNSPTLSPPDSPSSLLFSFLENRALCDFIISTNLNSSLSVGGWKCNSQFLPITVHSPFVCADQWTGLSCANGRVTSIDLTDVGISGFLPESFGSFVNLTRLSLSGNMLLGPFPESFQNLVDLSFVDLHNNYFGLGSPQRRKLLVIVEASPLESFAALSKLEYLDVGGNSFSGQVPQSLCNLPLKSLVLENIKKSTHPANNFSCISSCLVEDPELILSGSSSLPVCVDLSPTAARSSPPDVLANNPATLSSNWASIFFMTIGFFCFCFCFVCLFFGGFIGVEKDETSAFKWYLQSAEQQGDAFGQYLVAVCYEYGDGVGKSKSRALEWYRKAAAQGDVLSQRKVNELSR
jgi:hypothetical protein